MGAGLGSRGRVVSAGLRSRVGELPLGHACPWSSGWMCPKPVALRGFGPACCGTVCADRSAGSFRMGIGFSSSVTAVLCAGGCWCHWQIPVPLGSAPGCVVGTSRGWFPCLQPTGGACRCGAVILLHERVVRTASSLLSGWRDPEHCAKSPDTRPVGQHHASPAPESVCSEVWHGAVSARFNPGQRRSARAGGTLQTVLMPASSPRAPCSAACAVPNPGRAAHRGWRCRCPRPRPRAAAGTQQHGARRRRAAGPRPRGLRVPACSARCSSPRPAASGASRDCQSPCATWGLTASLGPGSGTAGAGWVFLCLSPSPFPCWSRGLAGGRGWQRSCHRGSSPCRRILLLLRAAPSSSHAKPQGSSRCVVLRACEEP